VTVATYDFDVHFTSEEEKEAFTATLKSVSHWHWSFCRQVAIACSTYWVKVPTNRPIVYNTKNGWKYALVGQACVKAL